MAAGSDALVPEDEHASAYGVQPDEAPTRAIRLSAKRIELIAVIVMSVTAILTAWSGFQSTKWSGIQSSHYTQAGAARVESTRLSTQAGQRIMLDASAYIAWAQALIEGNDAIATFAHDRFREELRVAADAWFALDPLTNPDAPPTPFDMPEYRVPTIEEASRLSERADELMTDAVEAGNRSESYVLSTVYFAVVLFFAAMTTKLDALRNQQLMLGFATVGLLLGLGAILTMPIKV